MVADRGLEDLAACERCRRDTGKALGKGLFFMMGDGVEKRENIMFFRILKIGFERAFRRRSGIVRVAESGLYNGGRGG